MVKTCLSVPGEKTIYYTAMGDVLLEHNYYTANGPKWPPKKCQDDFLAISVNNVRKESHWQELRKKSHVGFLCDIRECTIWSPWFIQKYFSLVRVNDMLQCSLIKTW